MKIASKRLVKKFLYALSVLTLAVMTGCRGAQSALDPAGPLAGKISSLWWMFFYICTAIFVLVIAALLISIARSRRARRGDEASSPVLSPDENSERRMATVIIGAVAASVIILFIFLFSDFFAGRTIYSLSDPDPLVITITGRQWWWEVQYEDPVQSNMVTTANEIHIPVGQPVEFKLKSTDVIHSFWVPNLNGKKDLIPGHDTTTWLKADKPGTFNGQCAEFCGHQHAHMRFVVIAEPPEQFNSWLEAQRQSPAQPASDSEKRGQQVFLSGPCVMCHTIQGTPAMGRVGPNLTHVASRQLIAAGTLPNAREHLANWVLDPQKIKPGTRMPMNNLNNEDLNALLDYIQSLK